MRFPLQAVFVLSLLGTPLVCLAQDPPSHPTLDQRYAELVEWLEAYEKWEAWTLKWGNRVAFNAAGALIKTRPQRPDPPTWLWDDCRENLAVEGKLARACQILDRWDELPHLLLGPRASTGLTPTDVPTKSSFLQRVHLSGGWVPAQLPAPSVYLVAGMQIGIVEVGRLTLPAVGAGVIAMTDGTGGYEWKPATVIGIGYRLVSFPFPGIKRESHLHINVARVTIHGARNLAVGLDPSQNLVGFSLTFSKAR